MKCGILEIPFNNAEVERRGTSEETGTDRKTVINIKICVVAISLK